MGEFDVRYEKQAPFKTKKVWFNSTSAVARGIGVCYNPDYTEETKNEEKANVVELPSKGVNNFYFAGVTVKAYSAITIGSGQWIDIYEPGGWAYIALGADTTEEVTELCCSAASADAGRFSYGKHFPGRGVARLRETSTTSIVASSYDGTGSVNSTTLTDSAAFGSVTAGDTCYIVAIEGGKTGVVGAYTVSSVGASPYNTVTLASAASASAAVCAYYIVSATASNLALAELYDGAESGLQEWIAPSSAAAAQSMVGGFTNILGGITLGTDSTATLADGTRQGELKGFSLAGALTTQDWLLTVTTGTKCDGVTACTTYEFDNDSKVDEAVFQWLGSRWQCITAYGPTVA